MSRMLLLHGPARAAELLLDVARDRPLGGFLVRHALLSQLANASQT